MENGGCDVIHWPSGLLNTDLADRRRVTDNCSESRQILVKLVLTGPEEAPW